MTHPNDPPARRSFSRPVGAGLISAVALVAMSCGDGDAPGMDAAVGFDSGLPFDAMARDTGLTDTGAVLDTAVFDAHVDVSPDGGASGSTEPGFRDAARSCGNAVRDGYEEGIDCGGACRACPPAPGRAVLYISDSVGDDSWSGSLAEPNAAHTDGPWRSLAQLDRSWDQVLPGHYVLLRRGDRFAPATIPGAAVIVPPPDKAGSAGAPITIGSYGTGALPVVSVGTLTTKGAVTSRGLSYFAFEDLEFHGALSFTSFSTAGVHHVSFRRIVFDGAAPGDATGGNIAFSTPPRVETAAEVWDFNPLHHIEFGFCLLQNNTVNDILNFNTPQGDVHIHHNEFYNAQNEALDFGGGDNLTIEYNLISGGRVANGMKVQPQLHTVDNLILRGNLVVHPNTEANWYAAVIMNARHARIYNNTFVGNNAAVNGAGSVFLGWMPATPVYLCGLGTWGFDDNEIHDNIFVGFLTVGVPEGVDITRRDGTHFVYSTDPIWDDNRFAHNTFYNPVSPAYAARIFHYNAMLRIWYDESAPGTYTNNDVWSVTSSQDVYSAGTFDSTWLSHASVSGDRYGDPMFVDEVWTTPFAYGDYHLRPGSPSAGAGCYP